MFKKLLEHHFRNCDLRYSNWLNMLPVQINAACERGLTPLDYAVSRGCENLTESLLRYGADPNFTDEEGWTALHKICLKGQDVALAKMLFEHCQVEYKPVEVDARDNNGCSPMSQSSRCVYIEAATSHCVGSADCRRTFGEKRIRAVTKRRSDDHGIFHRVRSGRVVGCRRILVRRRKVRDLGENNHGKSESVAIRTDLVGDPKRPRNNSRARTTWSCGARKNCGTSPRSSERIVPSICARKLRDDFSGGGHCILFGSKSYTIDCQFSAVT
ncbi:unnamed protein product [Trichogramma brassicae]|uniref:Uncharacterized protein n=1 Tax=Trichogramma brassicae TaxID=86971 RepID=A0A6H5I9Q1_9HYME|nr:unnamed protein product [Trichogramma brassicae]